MFRILTLKENIAIKKTQKRADWKHIPTCMAHLITKVKLHALNFKIVKNIEIRHVRQSTILTRH